jgi:hypothetical protein
MIKAIEIVREFIVSLARVISNTVTGFFRSVFQRFTKPKPRKLNIYEAMMLAEIIARHVAEKDIEFAELDESGIFDFIDNIVSKISPDEYMRVLEIITNVNREKLKQMDYLDLLALFTQGLAENKIITLLSFYYSLKAK